MSDKYVGLATRRRRGGGRQYRGKLHRSPNYVVHSNMTLCSFLILARFTTFFLINIMKKKNREEVEAFGGSGLWQLGSKGLLSLLHLNDEACQNKSSNLKELG